MELGEDGTKEVNYAEMKEDGLGRENSKCKGPTYKEVSGTGAERTGRHRVGNKFTETEENQLCRASRSQLGLWPWL